MRVMSILWEFFRITWTSRNTKVICVLFIRLVDISGEVLDMV